MYGSMFTQELKITKKIPGMTSPARSSETNIAGNVWHTMKLKLQSEIDMYKLSAEFTNAVCKFWRLLPIGYILIVYATIPHLLDSVIVRKLFSTKY